MKTEVDIAVIRNVRAMRAKLDVSQRTLAEVLGISAGYMGQIESEQHYAKYSVSHLYLIAKFFECDISELYPEINPLEP